MLRVLFRADGGPAIGDGHLMRCLALAQHVMDRGGACRLLTADPSARPVGDWRREAAAIETLASAPGGDADAEATSDAAQAMPADFVVTDGYAFTADYYARLAHRGVPVLRFDDTCERLGADIIVNQNPGAERRCRDMDAGAALLGCGYVMLRRALRSPERPPRNAAPPRVLVTLGGYDPDGLAPAIASALIDLTADSSTVTVVGDGRLDHATVIPPGDMDDHMRRADLAICAGGTTSLEFASLGVPMVIVVRAENQRPGARVLEEQGCAVIAGEGRAAVAAAARAAAELLGDAERRARMAACGRRLVDGKGVERVTDAMLSWIERRKALRA